MRSHFFLYDNRKFKVPVIKRNGPAVRIHNACRGAMMMMALSLTLNGFAVQDFASRCNQFILVLADKPIAADGLEVAHIANSTDVPPDALDAEKAIEQEFIGDVG